MTCTTQDRVRNTATAENAFKDFTEIYIKNPAMAAQKFPEMTSFMRNEWKKAFPKEAAAVQEASNAYADWVKNADALDQVRSRIYFEKEPTLADKVKDKLQWFKPQNIYDSFVRNFVNELADVGKVAPEAMKFMELYRAAPEMALKYITEGRFDFNEFQRRDQKTGKSLLEIIEPIKENREYASTYLAARTIVEDLVKKKKTDTDLYRKNVEAMKIAEKKFPEFKQFGKEFTEFMNDVLKFGRDSGLISDESYNEMLNTRQMYAPLNRVVEGASKGGLGMSSGMNPKEAIKLRSNVESMYDIVDPISSAFKNSAYMIMMAERNAVMRQLSKELSGKRGQVLFEEVTTPKKAKEAILNDIKNKGLPIEYFKDLPTEVLEVLTENPILSDSPHINVFENGKKKTYEIDPIIYEATKRIGSSREANIVTKLLSIPAQSLRYGATITPAYLLKAAIRDVPHALTTTQYGINIGDIYRGVFSAFKKDAWYQEFVRSGGSYSSAQSLNRSAWNKRLDQLSSAKKSGLIKRWVVENRMGLKKMEEFSHALENAPRIAEFRKGIESGASRQNAAHAARNITLDFQRKGAAMHVVNTLVPFSNAFVQGYAQFANFMKPKRNAKGEMTFKDTAVPYLRAMAYIGAPAVVNALMNAGNPRIRNMPSWMQHSFFMVDTAPFYDTEEEKKNAPIIKIPKTQEFGAIIGNGIEAAINYMYEKDPKEFENYFKENIGDVFTSRFLIPTAVAPALETWANKALFFNSPIVPHGRENLIPSEQYSEKTTSVFKSLSKGLGSIFGEENTFSPAIAENFVDRWSGSLGRDLLNGIDKGWRILQGEAPLEDVRASNSYFLRSFVSDYPSMNAKPIREFFENYKSADQITKTVQKLAKEGRGKEAQNLYKKFQKVKDTKTYKAVTRMMQFMQSVRNSKLPSEQKRELIGQTMLQLLQVAEKSNSRLKL